MKFFSTKLIMKIAKNGPFLRYTPVVLLLMIQSLALANQRVDSLRQLISEEIPDTTRVEAMSLLAFYLQYTDPIESEDMARSALELSRRIQFKRGEAASYYSLAGANWMMGNYDKAMEFTLLNLQLNEVLRDSARIVNARGMLGILYNEQNDHREALEQFIMVYDYWSRTTQNQKIFTSANNVGSAYFHMKIYDSALLFYNRGYEHLLKANDQTNQALCLNNIGGVYRETGAYDKAISYFERAKKVSMAVGNRRDEAVSHGNLGKAYMLKNDLESAKNELIQGFQKGQALGSVKITLEIVEDLYKVEARKKNEAQALRYHEIFTQLKDSIYNQEKLEQIKKLETSYEIEKRERELELRQQKIALLESDRKIQALWRNILALVVIFIVILALAIWVYQRQRIRKNKELYKTQQSLSKLELEAARLRENELQQELEYKNKALTSYTVNFIQKSELAEELKSKIEDMKTDAKGPIMPKLNALQKTLNQNYNIDKDWEDFKLYFEQVHSDFFTHLKDSFPGLSSAELKLCSLLRMNMNIKEMANIMAISPDSVKTARYRLRKKLDLSPDQSLNDFLMSF